jgi:hypothetical protein
MKQVGIMLHGTKIENTLIGGPAFGLLAKGDILIKIDGQPVSEDNILTALRGNDIPGSKVILTVHRVKGEVPNLRRIVPKELSASPSPDYSADEEDLEEIDISITRIATAEIADRRRMFDLFTFLEVIKRSSFHFACPCPLACILLAGTRCCERRSGGCYES